MRPILTREFCSRCSRFFTVTSIMMSNIFEDESLEKCLLHVCHPGIRVQILSFWKILFFSAVGFCPPDVLKKNCCCHRCCRCFFSRRPGFTRIVKATVSRCTLEGSSSFQRCWNLVSLTRDIPRFAVKIHNTHYRHFLLCAQQWTVIALVPASIDLLCEVFVQVLDGVSVGNGSHHSSELLQRNVPHLRFLSLTCSGMHSYFRTWRMSINATK